MDRRFRPFKYIYPSPLKAVPGSPGTFTVGLVRGSSVEEIIRDCHHLAELESDRANKIILIQFEWAKVKVLVGPKTKPRLLYLDWQKVVSGEFGFRTIGPRALSC